jgi:hypothetical protein
MTRNEIIDHFIHHDGVVVHFTKKDGTSRVLRGTRTFQCIPLAKHPREKYGESDLNLEIIRVFDVEAQDWRSFRVDSVTEISEHFDIPALPQ